MSECLQARLRRLLDSGPVLVSLDAAHPDVEVPQRLKGHRNLSLRLGYNLTPPITDLTISNAGVSATLTFGGIETWCCIPWDAVRRVEPDGWTAPTATPPKKRPNHLKLVN